MNRFSPSREPAAWVGLLSAVVAAIAIFGVHLPDGTEAATAAVITAGSAMFIRSKVSPAKQSVRIDNAPEVEVSKVDGNKRTTTTYRDGKFVVGGSVVDYALPAEVKVKSADDLRAENERIRKELGITPNPIRKTTKVTKKKKPDR